MTSARSITIFALLCLSAATVFGQASPYVVTTTADSASPTVGMLRFAMNSRNSCSVACPSITFAIPNTDPGCVSGTCTIVPVAPLPTVNTLSPPVSIDGQSQISFNGLNILINGNGLAGDGIVAASRVILTSFYIGGFPSGAAVRLGGTADSSSLAGLQIGITPGGAPLPSQVGILVDSGYSGGSIWGGVRNSIGDGIQLGTSPADPITSLRMFSLGLRDNGGLGIDLGNDGVTPNDTNDADTGVNNLQNYPVITSAAETSTGGLRVIGSFNIDDPSLNYEVEIYGTFAGDPEAASSLGVFSFVSPGTNTVAFDTGSAITGWSPAFTHVTATLTKRNFSLGIHETSEISAAAVVARADLALTKSGPATAVAGRPLSWTINVKNLSPEVVASGVTVTDTLPAGVTGATGTAGTEWTCVPSATTVTCTAATLPILYDGNITISAVAPVGPASMTNTATVSATTGNTVSTNDTATTATALTYPDLTLAKAATPTSVAPGGTVTFNITVTNGGAAGADGVQVIDTLPSGFTFVSAAGANWTCTPDLLVYCTWTGGELPPATSSLLTLVATASSIPGTYTNTATASASNESNTGNNTGSANVIVNAAPVANADSYVATEDVSLNVPAPGVLSNDTDANGDPLTASLVSGPANGTLALGADGSFTYTPNPNYNGPDSFTYAASDGLATTNATVTISVTAVNDAPVAGADSASTTADVPVTINVLANDTDAEGGTLTVTAWTNGTLGTVVCTAAGACTYTPTGASGTDSFTYTVSDGVSSTTGTVTVVVNPVSCPDPVAASFPTSGATVAPTGTLSWTGGAGADVFKIYLGPAGSGCSILVGTTTGSSFVYSGLTPGQYDWRVVAEKSGCSTPPDSGCIRFTVPDPCPGGAPSPVAPAPDAETRPEVRFEWGTVSNALRYHLVIFSPASGLQELAVVPQPAEPVPATLATTVTVPVGSYAWRVVADFPNGCPSTTSLERFITVIPGCPTAAPEPQAPLTGTPITSSPVEFRWTAVKDAIRYELFLSINGSAFQSAGTVVGTLADPSLTADVPAGATLSWYVQAVLPGGCPSLRSRTVEVAVGCFPPVLSIPGEVTTEKPYEVRATIVSTGARYLFQESDTTTFTTVLNEKVGVVDPTGEFVAALFEHTETAPRAYFYRVRLDQQGCQFSGVGRIVVVPLPSPTAADAETVVQLGNEEEIRQSLFIPSPTPALPTSYTFVATTDREWMRVEPAAGTIGPAGITVTVITNPVGLPVGSNTGTVILTFTAVAGGKSALETTPSTGSKPVSVTLVTPVTNKGKSSPADDSLIVPAVAHASGVNSEWQTDLRLLNLGTDKLKYALNLTVSGQDGTISGKSSEIELASGQNTALNDVVKQWYGLGSLPGEGATGVLEIRPLGPAGAGKGPMAVPVTRTLVSLASSRTYNKTPNGTLGEYIPAIPFASFVGGTKPEQGKKSILSLQQLAQSAAYRTNLGLVEASGQPVGVEIRFYDAEGVRLLTVPLSLQAGEHRQLNQVLAANNLTNVANARAEVEVVSGEGRIAAYASVVDNVTGDPLQVAAVDLAKLGARKYVMPGVAHFNTGQARWRTDVQMFNAGLASVSAKLDFFPVGATIPSRTATVDVGPGKIRTLSDIVPTIFGQSNTGGAIQISTTTNSELVVTGRTYDQRDEGSYGQFMAAVTEDDAIGLGDRAVQVLQMEESKNIRSNLGIVEVSGKEVRVELMAFPAESRVTPRAEFTLKPNEFRQFNAVLKSLNAGTTYNARVALRVIGGDGRIVAYGSAVDNLTQDPTYIPGQ